MKEACRAPSRERGNQRHGGLHPDPCLLPLGVLVCAHSLSSFSAGGASYSPQACLLPHHPRNTLSKEDKLQQKGQRAHRVHETPGPWTPSTPSPVSCHRGHFLEAPEKGPVLLGSPGSGLGLGSPSLSLHLLSKAWRSLVAASSDSGSPAAPQQGCYLGFH